MAFNVRSILKRKTFKRLKTSKVQVGLFMVVAAGLLGAIAISGLNLVHHLNGQDELWAGSISRAEREFSQLNREILRLSVLVNRSDQADFDPNAVHQQIDLLKSRLTIISRHQLSDDVAPEILNQLPEFERDWQALQGDLNRWLAAPQDLALQRQLHTQLVAFERVVNDLASKHTNQRWFRYGQLIELRSDAIRSLVVTSVLFCAFIGFAVWNTTQFIRERQRILTIIRDKEQQYRRIIETSEEGIWLLDPQGHTTFINQRMVEILGLDHPNQATNLWDFLPSEADQASAQAYLTHLREGTRSPLDLQLIRQDGQLRWLLTNGTAIFDETGQHTGTLCMLTDVTARKHSEEELKVAKQRAEVANQAKSDFLASMSHELRTPLNGILGYAQILSRSTDWGDKEQRGIQVIQQSGHHLLTLINDILDLTKIEARKLDLYPTEIDLPNFLHSIVGIIQMRVIEKDLSFKYHPPADLPPIIQADEKRLRQILLNLLGNAVKFTHTGGIQFQVQIVERSPQTATLRFAISDTGVGINPEQQDKIFLPFEQVGDQQQWSEGTGLGLAITHQLVKKLGGTLQVSSQLGNGSTFWFETRFLTPDRDVLAAVLPADSESVIGYNGPRRRILVVDDKLENRIMLQDLLESIGFDVVLAENGEQEVQLAQQVQPDLILTDLLMPIKNGLEAVEEIRRIPTLQHLPIIGISANVLRAARQKSQDAGCTDFLPKPIDEDQLLAVLKRDLQLTWIHAPASLTNCDSAPDPVFHDNVLPPIEDLEQLLDWAQAGRIIRIRQWAEQQDGKPYAMVVSHLHQLARGFQIKAIQGLIRQWVATKQSDGYVPASRPR